MHTAKNMGSGVNCYAKILKPDVTIRRNLTPPTYVRPTLESLTGALPGIAITNAVEQSTLEETEQMSVAAAVKALEERQERILMHLHQLQVKMQKMVNEADLLHSVPQTACETALKSVSQCSSHEIISDVAISASPSSPPLSVFILYRMLAQQKRVLLHSFVHSSVINLTVPDLTGSFDCQAVPVANRNHFQLGLSIIWKDVKRGASLMVSPGKQTPVVGEANIARYLARLLTPRYDDVDSDIVRATQIDSLLDYAAVLLHSNCDMPSAVKSLGQLLARKKWFVGSDGLSLADIVIWSTIKQRRLAAAVPDNVRQWLAKCDALPEFAAAERLLMN